MDKFLPTRAQIASLSEGDYFRDLLGHRKHFASGAAAEMNVVALHDRRSDLKP
jgi:hypothetical protein